MVCVLLQSVGQPSSGKGICGRCGLPRTLVLIQPAMECHYSLSRISGNLAFRKIRITRSFKITSLQDDSGSRGHGTVVWVTLSCTLVNGFWKLAEEIANQRGDCVTLKVGPYDVAYLRFAHLPHYWLSAIILEHTSPCFSSFHARVCSFHLHLGSP